jgi:hypothetical protein
VLFTLVLVILMGFAALAVDVGLLRTAKQNLWNALDAGALAGASKLPVDGAGAEALADKYLQKNFPGGVPAADVTVSFRCLIGSQAGAPRLSDIPLVCDPGYPAPAWTCNSSVCVAICDPAAGDTCNTIVVAGKVTVPYRFGPAVGVSEGNTGTVTSAACKGPCGLPPENPVDIVLIVDRTQSMNGVDTTNARNAAHSVRQMLNPAQQWLGYSMLGPSAGTGSCAAQPAGSIGTANTPVDVPRWVPVGLSGNGAHLNQDYTSASSAVARAITCYSNSSTGTDLRDPIPMATYELNTYGRAGVKKGIILMTDGQPNASTTNPTNGNYCQQANQAATAAKTAGIEIYTVAFGLDGANNPNCPDGSGAFKGKKASLLVASMATNSLDDNGCPGTENDDGDNYFCVPKTAGASADLSDAFRKATAALVVGTKLVQLP